MYFPEHSQIFVKRMKKLAKKDHLRFERLEKKMEEIVQDPNHYKPLGNILAGVQRVHLDPFILTFRVDEQRKAVIFLDFEHHDKAYKN